MSKSSDKDRNPQARKGEESAHKTALEQTPELPDPLLQCLVFLSRHYGRAKSAEALKAGLAYDERGMRPSLFCEAAENLGLKTKIVKREDITQIPKAVLPTVLILEGERACVLLSVTPAANKAKIYSPDDDQETDVKLDELGKSYNGYAILIHTQSELDQDEEEKQEAASREKHWFWAQIARNRQIYGLVILASVFINLFALTSPLFIMNVYDRVIPNAAIETGWALGIGALTIFAFDFIIRSIRGYLIDVASRRVDVVSMRRIYDQVLNMRIAGRPKSSGVFANMLRDFDSVREFFTSATITVLVDLPFTLFFLFVIYKLAGGLAWVLLALVLTTIVAGLIIKIPLKRLVRKATKSSEAKHGLLVETIHALDTIKTTGADGRFRARYSDYAAENAAWGQKSRFVSSLGINFATYLQQIASVLLVLFGMYMVQDGTLTMGGLIAAVILGGRALSPIGQIANLLTRYHQAGGALKTLDKIMKQPVERPAGKNFLHRPDLEGSLKFENVSFAYPGTDRKVLNDVSFRIEKGEKVGIVGRIGSGKSTITRLAMGLYETGDGTIYADDTDYRQIDPADLRRHIAYIAQDVVLFNGTIRDNISASLPHASEEAILEAAKASGVHEFVSRHPQGYDAPVGEHGSFLSGGQKQAVALARAMLLKPSVMLCDEPTNAMDIQAEKAFCHYVGEEVKDKTFIIVTHKTSILPMLDRLILLDQGRVIADGPRDEVLEALNSGKIGVPK